MPVGGLTIVVCDLLPVAQTCQITFILPKAQLAREEARKEKIPSRAEVQILEI